MKRFGIMLLTIFCFCILFQMHAYADDGTVICLDAVDVETGDELEGAHIQILDSEENVIEEFITSAWPYALKGLDAGEEYIARQVAAPEGYLLAPDIFFSFDETGWVNSSGRTPAEWEGKTVLHMENTMTRVRISCIDGVDGQDMEGAWFQLCDEAGNIVFEWMSTSEPYVIEGLMTGRNYYFRDIAPAEGYVGSSEISFSIDEYGNVSCNGSVMYDAEGNVVMIVEENRDYGGNIGYNNSPGISVIDVETEDELSGAQIQILDSEGMVILEFISDASPYSLEGLNVGQEYIVRELTAPTGYIAGSDVTFTIDEYGYVSTSGMTTMDENGNTILLMGNVKTRVSISCVDAETGEDIEGSELKLFSHYVYPLEQWISTSQPYVIEGLATGEDYYIREVIAPDGYTLSPETVFSIDEYGNVTSEGPVSTDQYGNVLLLVEENKTRIGISYVDAATGDPVEGARIWLSANNGWNKELVDEWTSVREPYFIEGLVTGMQYELSEEVSPEGYVLAPGNCFFLDENGDVSGTEATVTTDEDGNTILLIEIERISVCVRIVDRDNGLELWGAHMEILDSEGNIVETWYSDSDSHWTEAGLRSGEYYTLRETFAPDGYLITADTDFMIDDYGSITASGVPTFYEDGKPVILVENQSTRIRLNCLDALSGEELSGARIQILDSEGRIVYEWNSTYASSCVIDYLNVNEVYTIHEASAPEGYLIAADISFSIDEYGHITTSGITTTDAYGNTIILMENIMTHIGISCVDIATGTEVAGARLEILDSDGYTIYTMTSTSGSYLSIDGLAVNVEYTIQETASPEGYTPPADVSFIIDEYGNVTGPGALATAADGTTILLIEHEKALIPYENTLTLPAGLTTIDSEAFADLSQGVNIVIPDTVTVIAADAFKDSNVILMGSEGSFAEIWAREKGYEFIVR